MTTTTTRRTVDSLCAEIEDLRASRRQALSEGKFIDAHILAQDIDDATSELEGLLASYGIAAHVAQALPKEV